MWEKKNCIFIFKFTIHCCENCFKYKFSFEGGAGIVMAALINMHTIRNCSRLCGRDLKGFRVPWVNLLPIRFKSDGFIPIATYLHDHPIDTDVRIQVLCKIFHVQFISQYLFIFLSCIGMGEIHKKTEGAYIPSYNGWFK